MNLVDTSGWLEYFADSVNAPNFSKAIENTDMLIVSPICIYEVFKKVLSEKDEYYAIEAISLMKQGIIIDVNDVIAIDAALINNKTKLGMADCIIYQTAIICEAILYTQDSDFKNLPNVKYFPKK
ncbi:MAG TPA: VapC toxin family PIN domain ribonuclease [Bacteroidetes bacterium]|nr:type II toxin-antitoxin system VapC family toxin [Ignavibacteria bacterium]HCA43339.1 VapC toxin family PIN domain ribonuclease [Bacteroidota bacterium]HCN38027.1 VapC toxin family PIN domain ribonuclease [Bacteroidota bacterium]